MGGRSVSALTLASGQSILLDLPEEYQVLLAETRPAKIKAWLQEALEATEAERMARAAIKYNKGKPTISAEALYKECGI